MGSFLTEHRASELFAYAHGLDDDHAGSVYLRYFELRHARSVTPFTHKEAMQLLDTGVSTHNLILARRAGVTADEWEEVENAVDNDSEQMQRYFFFRVAHPRLPHKEALEALT